MLLLHISDTHLGSRRYDKDFREQDVFDVFTQLVEIAVKEHVKAVIHSGDLFDVYKPGNKALKFFVDSTKPLRDKGIHFINIPGDHDTPKVKEELYPQRLLGESLGLIKVVMGDQGPKFIELNEDGLRVKIYGIRHMSNVYKDALQELLSSIRPDGDRNVLMLHQGIREFLPYDESWQLELGSLPSGFQYYACGHLHSRRLHNLPGGGKLAISGSPEIIREEEIKGWSESGKGAFLIDLSKKEAEVLPLNVKVRLQKVININVDSVEQDIVNIRRSIESEMLENNLIDSKKRPILHVVLKGDSIKRGTAIKKLAGLQDFAEFYRIYKDETEDPRKPVDAPDSAGTVRELMESYLRSQGYNDDEVKLVLEIIEKHDSDEADELLRKFAELRK